MHLFGPSREGWGMAQRWLWTMVAAVLCCSAQAWAQTAGGKGQPPPARNVFIRGLVHDHAGNAAMAHVRVVLESVHFGLTSETSTDNSGRFEFTSLGHGIYFVRVKADGYVGASEVTRSCDPGACRRVDLTVGTSEFLNFLLDRAPSGARNVPPNGPADMVDAQDGAVPERARKEYAVAVRALDSGKIETGLAHLQKAIALCPDYAAAHFRLGALYADQHRWPEATLELKRVTVLSPRLARAQLALGSVYLEQKDYAAAEGPLKVSVELDPQTPFGHFGLARVELALDRLDDADLHVRKALELKPDFASAYVLLGNLYLRRKDPVSARKAYREYLRLEPQGMMASDTRNAVAQLERLSQPAD